MHDWILKRNRKIYLSHHKNQNPHIHTNQRTTTTTHNTQQQQQQQHNATIFLISMISSMISIEILQRPTTDQNDDDDEDNRIIGVDDPSYTIKVVKKTSTTYNSHSQQQEQLSTDVDAVATAATKKNEVVEVVNIPVLAFGMYKVPDNDDGVQIVLDAIQCGYRHFDSASIYDNEKTLGKALALALALSMTSKTKEVLRSQLFIASKVWNDVQKDGRDAVRRSVEQSLNDLQIDYLDICYVHWPVPGYFVETYRELMLLCNEGKIKYLGISNFDKLDYEELIDGIYESIFIPPLINQFEISPFMYRPDLIQYFQKENGILIAASKALNRCAAISDDNNDVNVNVNVTNNTNMKIIQDIATLYDVTYAQILLRWSFQKGYIVLGKTSNILRMKENRNIFSFCLSNKEMKQLDSITTENDIRIREELEVQRKTNS